MSIFTAIADNHDFTIHVPDGLLFDLDRSGSITDDEMSAFLAELDEINERSRRYADMYFFNQNCNSSVKKLNIRVPRKQAIARFRGREQVTTIVFSDKANVTIN